MKPICIFITLLFNSFYSTTPLFSQNIFDKQHSLDFAKYLINTQQYDYASIELERICFLEKNDTLNYFLIKTYRLSKKYEIGEKRTIQIYLNRALMPALPAKEYGLILLKQMKTDSLRHFLQENHYLDVAYKTQIELTSYIFEKKWEKSSQYFQQNHQFTNLAQYSTLIDQSLKIKRKSPFLAGLFSTVIPGTGKIYTGFWKDGLLGLLSIGTSTWQAYNGFSKNGRQSIYGWIFGSMATVFYLSNIYGSQKSAKHVNAQKEDAIIHQAEYIIDTD